MRIIYTKTRAKLRAQKVNFVSPEQYPLYWGFPQKPGASYSILQKILSHSIVYFTVPSRSSLPFRTYSPFAVNSAQLAVLRALFELAKMVCNQVPNGRMIRVVCVEEWRVFLKNNTPILASRTLYEYDPLPVCAFRKLMSRAFAIVGDGTGKGQK